MSRHTSVFPNEMLLGPPKGYIKGWEKEEPIKNKGSAERSPVKGENPNGPRNTSPIAGPLFGNSTPRNSLSPRTPTPRTPRRNQTPRHRTPLTPRKEKPTKRRFAPPHKTPRSTRRRR